MYTVCSLSNIKYQLVTQEQAFEPRRVLLRLQPSCSLILHTTSALFETTRTSISTSLLFPFWRPCKSFGEKRSGVEHMHTSLCRVQFGTLYKYFNWGSRGAVDDQSVWFQMWLKWQGDPCNGNGIDSTSLPTFSLYFQLLQSWLHSSSSNCCLSIHPFLWYGSIGRRLWLSWAMRTTDKYPPRFHGGKTRWAKSARDPAGKGLWLLMLALLVAVVIYDLTRTKSSGWHLLFKSLRIPGKHSLTLVQAPLKQKKPCMWQLEYFHLVWCTIDTDCSKELSLGFIELFMVEIIKEESHIVDEVILQPETRFSASCIEGSGLHGRKYYKFYCIVCILHNVFLPALCTLSPITSETHRSNRMERHSSFQDGLKSSACSFIKWA